jgi:hypothetical protein
MSTSLEKPSIHTIEPIPFVGPVLEFVNKPTLPDIQDPSEMTIHHKLNEISPVEAWNMVADAHRASEMHIPDSLNLPSIDEDQYVVDGRPSVNIYFTAFRQLDAEGAKFMFILLRRLGDAGFSIHRELTGDIAAWCNTLLQGKEKENEHPADSWQALVQTVLNELRDRKSRMFKLLSNFPYAISDPDIIHQHAGHEDGFQLHTLPSHHRFGHGDWKRAPFATLETMISLSDRDLAQIPNRARRYLHDTIELIRWFVVNQESFDALVEWSNKFGARRAGRSSSLIRSTQERLGRKPDISVTRMRD